MIIVRDLTKLYGDFPAVRSISFHVDAGEILGLVGPNGAGKTTTLRCLAGIISPSSGSIAIAGHDMHDDAIAAKRALAFIPDEPHLFDYLSVEEHLRFIARLYGVADVETRMPA
ncbi:MAG: ATP-binding cassette domain-containing protein, partial [Deltaproteobacteria bacterium]